MTRKTKKAAHQRPAEKGAPQGQPSVPAAVREDDGKCLEGMLEGVAATEAEAQAKEEKHGIPSAVPILRPGHREGR